MKRSEAEKHINDWLDQSEVITGKTILDFVEEFGILPPFSQPFDTSLGEAEVYVENYKWEEE